MIRLAVACDPNHCDAESMAVLEWSVVKNTSCPVEMKWIKLSNTPGDYGYGWNTEKWATPFSGLRWGVAELYNHTGHYIYSDSDVIFLGDLAELWNQPFNPGKVVLAKGGSSWRYCVSKWDAKAASDHIPPLEELKKDPLSHQKMGTYFRKNMNLTQAFEGDWNCLDGQGHPDLLDGKLKAVHYTNIPSQVHLPFAIERLKKQERKHWYDGKIVRHPREDLILLFDKLLKEAHDAGFTVDRYTQDELFGSINKRSFE